MKIAVQGYKHCHKCNTDRPLSDFYKNRTKKDGHSEKCKYCHLQYRVNYKSKRVVYDRKYREENRILLNAKRLYKRKTNLNFKLSVNVRKRICQAIKFGWKSGSSVKDMGCTIEELKQHLEKKWVVGMNWNNWGRNGWHIDHIRPLNSFDLSNREEFLEAVNYKNLRPLWAKDNLSKGSKWK